MAELENIIESVMSSPESMSRVMDIVKLLGGQNEEEKKEEVALPQIGTTLGFEPEMISKVMSLVSEYNADDDRRIRLLEAIRPYVKTDEEYHIDKAIRIIKLSRVAKGVFEEFLK